MPDPGQPIGSELSVRFEAGTLVMGGLLPEWLSRTPWVLWDKRELAFRAEGCRYRDVIGLAKEYNAKNKHRITGMTPYEARKPSNEADVKASIELAATHGLKFPPLRVGDTVRMLQKIMEQNLI